MTATADDVSTDQSDRCFRCSYDLRGVADDQACPECGLLAERSRRLTDELQHTRPEWLRRISLAMVAILFAIILPVIWYRIVVEMRYALDSRLRDHFQYFGLDAAALSLLSGAFLLTSREDATTADGAVARQRRRMRWAALVPPAGCALLHYATDMPWARSSGLYAWLDELSWLALFMLTLGCVPLPILLFRRLHVIAHRARSQHLAEHSTIVGVGNALTLVYVLVYTLLNAWAADLGWGYNWIGRSNFARSLTLVLGVSAILFALWNMYLLVRFAIAFGKAARVQRRLWREGDRAAN